jgi:hypothetical protein
VYVEQVHCPGRVQQHGIAGHDVAVYDAGAGSRQMHEPEVTRQRIPDAVDVSLAGLLSTEVRESTAVMVSSVCVVPPSTGGTDDSDDEHATRASKHATADGTRNDIRASCHTGFRG